jgi:DNA-binding NarL/FixJ family response regulator
MGPSASNFVAENAGAATSASRICASNANAKELELAVWSRRDRISMTDPLKSFLSERDKEILLHIANGLTDREIAAELNLSPKTINFRVEEMKRKLDAKTRAQVLAIALRQGWIY